MRLSQRLFETAGSDEKLFELALDLHKKHPGCFNDVWLTTAYGYPSKEYHKAHAALLARAAKKFRENGITVALQVANTIGHGEYMRANDCSGLVFDGSPAEPMVGADGKSSPYSFCPRGKFFRAYINETLSYYGDVKPDCLWVDDDFRMLNHAPVTEGCYCADCIAKFNTRYGTSFKRETLVQEMLHGDLIWRERYLRFQREGMEEMMQEMMETFHALSPDTVGGLQHAVPLPYTMGDHAYAFEPMRRVTGKSPWSRPGGGTYNDHDPNRILEKGVQVAFQNARLPRYVTEIYPEIENIPHSVYGKSPAGTALETSYYFAVGATNMSYSMLKLLEDGDFYAQAMKLFAAQHGYWQRLSEANRVSRPAGLTYFVSRDAWARSIRENEGMETLQDGWVKDITQFFRDGLPITFDERCEDVYLLHPEEAKKLSDKDIESLLGRAVITDGETLSILASRGVDLGVDVHGLSPFDILALHQAYTDHPINRGEAVFHSSFFTKGKKEATYLLDRTGKAEILGTYASETLEIPFTKDPVAPFGVAELVVTTAQGGRWAVLGYQPWKAIITKARRDHLLDLAEYLAGKPVCARVISSHQMVLHPRVDEKGDVVCATVVNCTIGKCEGATLMIRQPCGDRFVFESQYLPPMELTAHREGDAYVMELPVMDAWSQGTVFCKS